MEPGADEDRPRIQDGEVNFNPTPKMTMFEHAFEPLNGFEFEDAQSRENALWLWTFLTKALVSKNYPMRFPLVVVTGASGVVKTAFVEKMLRGLKAEEILRVSVFNQRTIDRAAAAHVVAFVCEDFKIAPSDLMARFLTGQQWLPECRGGSITAVAPHAMRCVSIAVCGQIMMSEDLVRRSISIRLKSLTTRKD